MPEYLVAIYLPDDYDQSIEDEANGPRYRHARKRDGGCRCEHSFSWRPLPPPSASVFHFTHVDAVHLPLINC